MAGRYTGNGIKDAGERDFANLERRDDFATSSLSKEFWLGSNDPDPWAREPLAVNRLYRDLRNIRVHFGEQLVTISNRVQLGDLSDGRETGLPRWYLVHLESRRLDVLDNRQTTEFEIHKLNQFLKHRTLVSFLSQNLMVMVKAVSDTANQIRK